MSRIRSTRSLASCALVASLLLAGLGANAPQKARYSVETLAESAPKEVPEAIGKTLEGKGIRVLDRKGKAVIDLWFRKSIEPQEPKKVLGIAYGRVREGTLVGVARLHAESEDFRGQTLKPGVFTLRYGVQPQDGDHLGVSETRDFLLLSPAKLDKDPKPLETDAIVELSTEASGTSHPAVIYLVAMFDKPKDLPRVVEEDALGYWVLDCAIAASGAESSDEKPEPVRLGIVIEGQAAEL